MPFIGEEREKEKVRCGSAEKPAQSRTQKDSTQKEYGKGDLIWGNFTFEEMNLMCIYNTGTAPGRSTACMKCGELSPEETELRELTDSALTKLCAMTDEDFAELGSVPGF